MAGKELAWPRPEVVNPTEARPIGPFGVEGAPIEDLATGSTPHTAPPPGRGIVRLKPRGDIPADLVEQNATLPLQAGCPHVVRDHAVYSKEGFRCR